jgi:DHA3 family tetracycline resistance protein-like MFS transporter
VLLFRSNPRLVYLIMGGANALFFSIIWIAMPIYRIQVIGLNPFQLVFLGTVLELTAFVFEIPTGVVADAHSRRLSVVIGTALLGAGFALEGIFPLYAVSLLCQFITGVGYTFISGAAEAWISDEIGEESANRAFLRSTQVNQVSAVVGTILGALLATGSLQLPIVLGGAAIVGLAAFLSISMTEHGFTPTPREERSSWHALTATFRDGLRVIRAGRLLITILAISAILGAYSEGFDRLWQAHFLANIHFPEFGAFEPVVWFGALNVVVQLLSLIVTEIARRRVDTGQHHAVVQALIVIYGIMLGAMIVFGLSSGFALGAAAFTTVTMMRITAEPLNAAWLNQQLESSVRATVFSIRGQADALGQIIGGPLIGLVATVFSLRAVMLLSGLLIAPALLLYRRSLNHEPVSQTES